MLIEIERKKLIIIYFPVETLVKSQALSSWRQRIYTKLLWLIARLTGYSFVTLSQALKAPVGKFICLVSQINPQTNLEAPLGYFKRARLPYSIELSFDDLDAGGSDSCAVLAEKLKTTSLRLNEPQSELLCSGKSSTNLTQLNRQQQTDYIEALCRFWKDHLDRTPTVFAYPQGTYDVDLIHCLKAHHFIGALTHSKGINWSGYDPFQLKRIDGTFGHVTSLLSLIHVPVRSKLASGLQSVRRRTLP